MFGFAMYDRNRTPEYGYNRDGTPRTAQQVGLENVLQAMRQETARVARRGRRQKRGLKWHNRRGGK